MESSNPMTASMSTQPVDVDTAASTLYPKITTHISEIVTIWKELGRSPNVSEEEVILDPISIVGTVKLHGTHADILVYSDDQIVFQSRGVTGILPEKDNAGFAAAMSSKTKALLRLRDLFVHRFNQLNPGTRVNPTYPILIAGEWIGKSIQKDVAISNLSKRLVIISVNINGQWQKDSNYGGIALPNHDIYNISRAGYFNCTLYPNDIQRTTNELESLTEQVAKRCPFATTFGLDGLGEGIVWKPAFSPYNANPSLWFKTKGGRFKPTFYRPPRQSREASEEYREAAAGVAKIWTSEQRLMQGLEYMQEQHIKRNMKGLSAYLKWVQNDIAVEEKSNIDRNKIDAQTLRIEIAKIAKPWYVERLGE